MPLKHGVYVYENATALTTPVRANNSVQVIIGTAPVFMVDDPAAVTNKPVLCASATEAMDKLGYCTDFSKYTLCQSMFVLSQLYQVAPIVFINVLDVTTHKGTAETVNLSAPVASSVTVDKVGAIKSLVTVSQDNEALTAGTDYTLAYTTEGKLVINFIPGSAFDPSKAAVVSVTCADPTLVNDAAVIGSYNASTGVATGIELVRNVYPRLGEVPSILLAPGFSHHAAVGVALAAKAANINGVFKGMAVVDIDTDTARTYTQVENVKKTAGYTSPFCYPIWPSFKVSEHIIAGSAVAAALMAYTDAQNDGIPARSPSNKIVSSLAVVATCLADGTEVVLDQDQATVVNSYGVTTGLHMNGWRLWGSYTGAYPTVTDPKDIWVSVRRMFNWQANTFILTYFDKVDDPINPVLIESVVDSENIRCAAYAPDKWAGAKIHFLQSDNPIADLLAGKIVFRQSIAPYTPAQEIDNILSYDTSLLEDVISGVAE